MSAILHSNRSTVKAVPRTLDSSVPTMVFSPANGGSYAPETKRTLQCYCGKASDSRSGMYCSLACARGDAFSSLTHCRESIMSSNDQPDEDLDSDSRAPSAASQYSDWEGSHYRRIARADRDELRARRMRRTEYSASPTCNSSYSVTSSTMSPGRVPDLIHSHSRSTSSASSVFSLATSAALSRNPSTSSSRQGNYATTSVVVDDAIMEDDLEEISAGHLFAPSARSTLKPPPSSKPKGHSRDMRDMQDVLDEILSMEKSFQVEDEREAAGPSPSATDDAEAGPSTPQSAVFLPAISRPPRTPSPVSGKRGSMLPPEMPGAPDRGHNRRSSLMQTRPPSLYAHQSSLSESHTALYLATASPVAPSRTSGGRHRRSASPNLSARRSISFTPQTAGPALPPPPRNRFDSPGLTPVRRKHLTPNAVHPAMDGWRFPVSSPTRPSSTTVTPTRPQFDDAYAQFAMAAAPEQHKPAPQDDMFGQALAQPHPQFRWPRALSQATLGSSFRAPAEPESPRASSFSVNLAPRSRTAMYIPDDSPEPPLHGQERGSASPPPSGLRLGELLGSGGGMDVDVDADGSLGTLGGLEAPVPPFAQGSW